MGKKISGCLVTVVVICILVAKVWSLWESHVEDNGISVLDQANKLLKAGDPASLQKAIPLYKQAADILHGMHDAREKRNEGICYYDLGNAYDDLGQEQQAVDAYQQALPLLTDTDATADRADAYKNLGIVYGKMHQPDKALDACRQAQSLYQGLGDTQKANETIAVEAEVLYNQGVAAAKTSDWPKALTFYQQAQALYHQAGKYSDEADAYHQMSLIYTITGDKQKAADASQQEQTLRAGPGGKPAG